MIKKKQQTLHSFYLKRIASLIRKLVASSLSNLSALVDFDTKTTCYAIKHFTKTAQRSNWNHRFAFSSTEVFSFLLRKILPRFICSPFKCASST